MISKLLVRKLPVFTDSGYYLGRLQTVDLEQTNDVVLRYVVTRGCWRFRKVFLIHPSQVLKINYKKMVVQDTVITLPSLKEIKTTSSVTV